jgi:hypothetical protein
MGFLSKPQIWEDSWNNLDDVDSRPDVLIHKASRALKKQTSERPSSWSGRASFIYEIECIKFTVWMTEVMVRTRQALIWKLHAAKVRLSGR